MEAVPQAESIATGDKFIIYDQSIDKSGMFLIGGSGSGKTKTIQHICKEYCGKYVIMATTPKCGVNLHNSGIGLFFDDLVFEKIYTETDLLQNINNIFKVANRNLLLIYDGLNEMSSNSNECIRQYKALLNLMETIFKNGCSTCKVIVTCRDFAFLDISK